MYVWSYAQSVIGQIKKMLDAKAVEIIKKSSVPIEFWKIILNQSRADQSLVKQFLKASGHTFNMGRLKIEHKKDKDIDIKEEELAAKIFNNRIGQKIKLHCSNCNTRNDCMRMKKCWTCFECNQDITSKFKDITFRWKNFCSICCCSRVMLWSGQEYICTECLEPVEEIA